MSAKIVAEAGSNHDGSLDQAHRLIDEAANAGADAVKFQCLPDFPREWMPQLMEYAKTHGLDCFATPFDVDAVRELADLGVPYIKIASAEIVRDDLIATAALTGIPLILSTGMASADELEDVRGTIWDVSDVTILQCTVRYPTPPDAVNLRAMVGMGRYFDRPVGLSDHTQSIVIPAAAIALGATMIEKHLTLEPERCRNPKGPDHPFALWPAAFRTMVDGIREVEAAMGDGRKDGPRDGEMVEARGRRLQWATT